jgi:hypothetical protein
MEDTGHVMLSIRLRTLGKALGVLIVAALVVFVIVGVGVIGAYFYDIYFNTPTRMGGPAPR